MMPLDARDLAQEAAVRDKWKRKSYRKEYQKCAGYIRDFHRYQRQQATTYEVPLSKLGEPFYNVDECVEYMKRKLVQSNFYVRICLPGNKLFISWDPQHVEKVQAMQRAMGITQPNESAQTSPTSIENKEDLRQAVLEDIGLSTIPAVHRQHRNSRRNAIRVRRR